MWSDVSKLTKSNRKKSLFFQGAERRLCQLCQKPFNVQNGVIHFGVVHKVAELISKATNQVAKPSPDKSGPKNLENVESQTTSNEQSTVSKVNGKENIPASDVRQKENVVENASTLKSASVRSDVENSSTLKNASVRSDVENSSTHKNASSHSAVDPISFFSKATSSNVVKKDSLANSTKTTEIPQKPKLPSHHASPAKSLKPQPTSTPSKCTYSSKSKKIVKLNWFVLGAQCGCFQFYFATFRPLNGDGQK